MEFQTKFFIGNRERLCAALPGHFVVLTANALLQSSADLSFPFRQDRSFWYLSGVDEPDVILTIDCDSGESVLYVPEQNDYQKEWDGESDHESLLRTSGVSEIRFISELPPILKQRAKSSQKIGYLPPLPERVEPYGFYANPARQKLEDTLIEAGVAKKSLVDVRKDIARLRQVKQPCEIDAIQQAIDATGRAIADVRKSLQSYKTEADVERALTIGFYEHGGDGHAFQPIVAAGKNAATIHYEKNDAPLGDGLLLLDVGTQVGGYAADISRTLAVSGKPSKRQQDIWDACLRVQQAGIAMLKPGVIIREYQKELETVMERELQKLDCSMAGQPFPHGFSHFLGLDVHDAGVYDEPLVAGCVLTVEPGVYLADEGIGVRVEDNVLITENGCKNLSKHIPKVL